MADFRFDLIGFLVSLKFFSQMNILFCFNFFHTILAALQLSWLDWKLNSCERIRSTIFSGFFVSFCLAPKSHFNHLFFLFSLILVEIIAFVSFQDEFLMIPKISNFLQILLPTWNKISNYRYSYKWIKILISITNSKNTNQNEIFCETNFCKKIVCKKMCLLK